MNKRLLHINSFKLQYPNIDNNLLIEFERILDNHIKIEKNINFLSYSFIYSKLTNTSYPNYLLKSPKKLKYYNDRWNILILNISNL